MFGAIFSAAREFGTVMFKTGAKATPIELGEDDSIQMVSTPQTVVDIIFNFINRALRPGLVLLVLYMFYWFAKDLEHASKWIDIVAKIPGPMWDVIMIIITSLGLSKVIRDAKAQPAGPQMVVKTSTTTVTGNVGDGAAKPEVTDDDPVPTPTDNPTLAAWRAAQASKVT